MLALLAEEALNDSYVGPELYLHKTVIRRIQMLKHLHKPDEYAGTEQLSVVINIKVA